MVIFFSCSQEKSEIDKIPEESTTIIKEKFIEVSKSYGYNIIKNADNSFGYKIFKDGQAIIKQEHIPAISGNHGFETEKQAKSLAELVIKKLENQIMPPTVTVEEVDSIRELK